MLSLAVESYADAEDKIIGAPAIAAGDSLAASGPHIVRLWAFRKWWRWWCPSDCECDDCDDDNGERYRKGKALMELMDRYAEKAGAYPDSTIMAIRASLPPRV